MLNILYKKFQKVGNLFGYNLIISRIKVNSNANFAHQVEVYF